MIEQIRRIDNRLKVAGRRVREDLDRAGEFFKTVRYEYKKSEIEERLDYLSNEISAAKELMRMVEKPEAQDWLRKSAEGLIDQRVEVVRGLPQYAKDADLERIVALSKADNHAETADAESEGSQKTAPSLSDKHSYTFPSIVNEGPVDPGEFDDSFKKTRLVAPVAGGSTGSAASTSTSGGATPIRPTTSSKPYVIHPTHWEYIGSRVDPTVDARWTDSSRKRIVTDLPTDPDRGRLRRMWDKLRGREKIVYRPYDEQDVIKYRQDPSDPDKDTYFVRERSSKGKVLGAVAGTAFLAWGLHQIPATRAVMENAGLISPSHQTVVLQGLNTDLIRSNVAAEMEAQRPAIVRDVANEIKTFRQQEASEEARLRAAQTVQIVEQVTAKVEPLVKESVMEAAAVLPPPPPLGVLKPVEDLGPAQVVSGKIEHKDLNAENITGRGDHSFVRGMIDYLIIRNHMSDWGLTGEADPYNARHAAALNAYKTNPATDRDYLIEYQALERVVINETLEKYPGRGEIFHWVNVDGKLQLMIWHNTSDGTKIVPVYPDSASAERIVKTEFQQAIR